MALEPGRPKPNSVGVGSLPASQVVELLDVPHDCRSELQALPAQVLVISLRPQPTPSVRRSGSLQILPHRTLSSTFLSVCIRRCSS